MIIDCISDLHGHYPKLEGGDLLIVAGDLTAGDELPQYMVFREWLRRQKYNNKIFICGNHDCKIANGYFYFSPEWIGAQYLCDSGTEFEYFDDKFPKEDEGFLPSGKITFKVWGSPWTRRFEGMNPHCKAFTCDTEEELAEKWALIPDDIDILVTHSPAWGSNDKNIDGERCGSKSLCHWIANHSNSLKLHVHGHIHESYGIYDVRKLQAHWGDIYTPVMVNASHVNEHYEPVNKPIRIVL